MFRSLLFGIGLTLALVPVQASADDLQSLMQEAESVRAIELSPHEYQMAKDAAAKGDEAAAMSHAKKAIANSMTMSDNFTPLIEARDRMQLAKAAEVRKDLADRAEEAFANVVAAVEDEDLRKAKKEAEMASLLTYQAEVVAAREQLTRPIAREISDARRQKGNDYAPKSYKAANDGMHSVERMIKDNPAAQGQAVSESQRSVALATKAKDIGIMGSAIRKDAGEMEARVYARDKDMGTLADLVGVKLTLTQSHAEQTAAIRQALQDMKKSYESQLADANKQIADLNGNMSELEEARFKLKLKREAEAKIAQLAKLFNPDQVEIFLTTDADVIIRMKTMNFRSGSAVIPPESYQLLDLASKAIELFGDRAVRVEGHTDSVSSNSYNQKLSERRANTVKEYLEARFQDQGRTFTAIGFGEEKPIANNETAEGRRKNRRIDIVLIAPQMQQQPSQP